VLEILGKSRTLARLNAALLIVARA
jgi:hypothetical protein